MTNYQEGDEQRFIPLSDYILLEEKLALLEIERSKMIDERNQLRDALEKINSGITRASDIVTEGIARLADQKMITDLAFRLRQLHPRIITIKYRGETVIEIFEEK